MYISDKNFTLTKDLMGARKENSLWIVRIQMTAGFRDKGSSVLLNTQSAKSLQVKESILPYLW